MQEQIDNLTASLMKSFTSKIKTTFQRLWWLHDVAETSEHYLVTLVTFYMFDPLLMIKIMYARLLI